jgi:hypothetical protein
MSDWCKRGVTAALSLILSAGAARSSATPITVVGGNSTTVGGWKISPDPGITLTVTGVNSDQTLVIQKESATFGVNSPLSVSFKQVGADAASSVDLLTAAIADSTGSGWTKFAFALTGSATFESVSDVFAPPLGTGVDYTNAQLGTARTTVLYAGSQLSGSTSDWGSSDPGDDLLISANPSTGSDNSPYADFTLEQSPEGIVSEVVNGPQAAWQSLAGLLVVAVLTSLRLPKTAKAPA